MTETNSGVPTEENVDLGPSFTYSPLLQNRTYLGNDDEDFKKWLRKQNSETRTRLEEQYRSLENYNRGTHKSRDFTYRPIQHQLDDWHLCHAIACQLEFCPSEKKALCNSLRPLDMRNFQRYDRNDGSGTRKSHLVAYCAAILIHNKWCDDDLRYYPGKDLSVVPKWDGLWRLNTTLQDRPYLFKKLAADLEFDDETVISCLEKLRAHSSY